MDNSFTDQTNSFNSILFLDSAINQLDDISTFLGNLDDTPDEIQEIIIKEEEEEEEVLAIRQEDKTIEAEEELTLDFKELTCVYNQGIFGKLNLLKSYS